jgi:adenylate kinase
VRVVIMGAPGAGKGTQAKLLQERLGLAHISTGDILRDARKSGTSLGKEAQRFMEQGRLVPDDVVIGIVADRLATCDGAHDFLLDGFPRTVEQAKALDAMLARCHEALDFVVAIDVPEDELVRRLAGRRVCRSCQSMYQVDTADPNRTMACTRCDGELYQREDDREETVRARFDVHKRATAPVLQYYRDAGLLREVVGKGTPEEVYQRMAAALR